MFARSVLRICQSAARRKFTTTAVVGVAAGTIHLSLQVPYEARGLPRWMRSTRTRFDNFAENHKLSLQQFLKALLCYSLTFKPEHNPAQLNPNAAARLFQRIDQNNDGFVQYEEFAAFLALLNCSTPELEILFKMYDFDHSGSIEHEEFKAVVKTLLEDTKIEVDEAIGINQPNGLIHQVFGNNTSVDWPHVKAFMEDLKKEVDHVEFCQYDYNHTGKITANTFVHMLSRSTSGYYLPPDVVQQILSFSKHPEQESVTEGMWNTFSRLMNMSDELGNVIKVFTKSGCELTRADFKRAVKAASGVELDSDDINLVFATFDVNGDGTLEYDEFMSVMKAKRISRN